MSDAQQAAFAKQKTEHLLGIGSTIIVPSLVHSDQGGMYWEGIVTAISASGISAANIHSGEVVEVSREEVEKAIDTTYQGGGRGI